jgi:hypothetical protein
MSLPNALKCDDDDDDDDRKEKSCWIIFLQFAIEKYTSLLEYWSITMCSIGLSISPPPLPTLV